MIPGISPIRAVVDSSPALRGLGIAHKYPVSQIIYEDGSQATKQPARDTDPPAPDAFIDHIKMQVKSLPDEIMEDIRIEKSDDLGIVRIPVDQSHNLVLAIQTEPPYEILSAMLGYNNGLREPSDITDEVRPRYFRTTILVAYNSTKRMLKSMADNAHSPSENQAKNSIETDDECSKGPHKRRKDHVESVATKTTQV